MPPILLSTLNAKYIHAAFGLRCLLANMGDLAARTRIAEFDINQRPLDVVERLLAHSPAIIGLGVYVWNARQSLELVRLLKQIAPSIRVVLGGPEVSHECDCQEICRIADVVITGEADLKFAEVCRQLLAGDPVPKLVVAELPNLAQLASPYPLYDAADIANRVVYVEASRGCPFHCEFCLSSLDIPVRQFPLEPFLAEMERLMDRGLRRFKFVDRTFNLHLPTSLAIADFFQRRCVPGLFVHFEVVPDRLPEALREAIASFPPGVLQFEAGVQTFNPEVAARIDRRQNYERLESNLRFLREHTSVHIHADLIAGLPGEDIDSFALGFDRLVALRPHEIQVGILKRLRGTPIHRHTESWGMVYCEEAPYELLCNKLVDFPAMQRMRRFAKYWDQVVNSGNYVESAALLWLPKSGEGHEGSAYDGVACDIASDAAPPQKASRVGERQSAFRAFAEFTEWAYVILQRTDSIALSTWAELLFRYLTSSAGGEWDAAHVKSVIRNDFVRAGRTQWPEFLRGAGEPEPRPINRSGALAPKRQQRHL